MSQNIFDFQSSEPQIEEVTTTSPPSQGNGITAFLGATFSLALIALVAPIYIHVLVKIATWSWNLI